MKNLTSLCADWPLSPSCSGFPFRTEKPYPSCLAINPVCSHQGFSWKKQSQWSPAMSKSTFNCDTAWSRSKVGVAETRSALICVTAVLLIKWSISNFARVSQAPPNPPFCTWPVSSPGPAPSWAGYQHLTFCTIADGKWFCMGIHKYAVWRTISQKSWWRERKGLVWSVFSKASNGGKEKNKKW